MEHIDQANQNARMFFDKYPLAFPIYEAFQEKLYSLYPEIHMRARKTQITFSNKRVFACVSFAQVKRKAELPDPYIVITLGLPAPIKSERAAVKTEPYPGRWTNHIVVGSSEELNEELFSWVEQAYAFSRDK